MITTMKAYSSWPSATQLLLDPSGLAETDFLQITNVEGLGPVNAAVNTSSLGSMDGDTYVGSTVSYRNIVLTIQPNPNWSTWTYATLRQLLYSYFMPKRRIRLVFETDEFPNVEILGYVESNEPQIFSKTGEIQVSVICPYPYFTSIEPVTIDGTDEDEPFDVDYEGTIETGVNVQVSWVSGGPTSVINMVVGDSDLGYFRVGNDLVVDEDNYFVMSSVAGQKYAQSIALAGGQITNLLPKILEGSTWPTLQPGANNFWLGTGLGVHNWRLVYYNRYGGL